MRPVADELLLTIAQIAATLMGLLLVAVFFYVESGIRRLKTLAPEANRYMRATTKVVMLLYALVLALSLALVLLETRWASVVLIVMSAMVVLTLVEWTVRSRTVRRMVRIRGTSVWGGWTLALLPLLVPWIVDGWAPSRQTLTLTLVLVGAFAFANSVGLLLVAFDLADLEKAASASSTSGDGAMSTPSRGLSTVGRRGATWQPDRERSRGGGRG